MCDRCIKGKLDAGYSTIYVKEEPKEYKSLDSIWGVPFWNDEAKRIELAYWDLIKEHVPNTPTSNEIKPTEHRIEWFVRKLSKETGIGNLHVGLTSSDLEENIRIKRLDLSVKHIQKLLEKLKTVKIDDELGLTAYTHLMPAGRVALGRRVLNSLGYAFFLTPEPVIYRGIKGALGDRRIQYAIGLCDEELDPIFDGITEPLSTQTSSHVCDLDTAWWISGQAAFLAQFANNVRQMYALGQAETKLKDIGSTAIPAKAANPWKFERASGMCEELYNLPGLVARTIASCLLERTLTDQSVLTHAFRNAFKVLEGVIKDVTLGLEETTFKDNGVEVPDSEMELLGLVQKGKNREQAHSILNQKYVVPKGPKTMLRQEKCSNCRE